MTTERIELVTYNGKHNEENGENNLDGLNENYSNNYGVEGETDDQAINSFRERQLKNLITLLFISRGIPMVLAGDEIKRTQHGNNNTYCQDNELGWFDWSLAQKNRGFLRFFKIMVEFRKNHPCLQAKNFFSGKINSRGLKDISWHGTRLNSPGFDDPDCKVLSFTVAGKDEEEDLQIMINMSDGDLDFELVSVQGRRWFGVADTSCAPPNDIYSKEKQQWLADQDKYQVKSKSIVIITAR